MPSAPTSTDLSSILALLSFNNKSNVAVSPFPAPLAPKPLAPTSFQISPFQEKIVKNPYETFNLSALTQAQLSIDTVVSYLETLVPTELLVNLQNDLALGRYLVATGLTLEQTVTKLMDSINNQNLLTDLLRAVPMLSLLANVPPYLTALLTLGLSLNTLSNSFSVSSLTQMTAMSVFMDVAGINEGYANMALINGVNPIYASTNNPLAIAAISLATISVMASNIAYSSNYLSGYGINYTNSTIAFINNCSSVNFAVIANGIQLAGVTTSGEILAVMNIVNKLGIPVVNALITLLTASPVLVIDIATYLNTYGIPTVTNLVNCININGLSTTLSIISIINGFSMVGVQSVLSYISINGLVAYEAFDTSGTYATLLTAVSNYGVVVITELTSAILVVGSTTVTTVATNINTLTTATTAQLTGYATTYSSNTLFNAVNELYSVLVTVLPTIMANLTVIISGSGIVTPIGSLNTSNTAAFLKTSMSVDIDNIIPNINLLNSLSSILISNISSQISSGEAYTVLANNNVAGIFLNYSIRQATEIAALVGNYHMVLNLLNNYSGLITNDYRRYLINTILANYKTTVDDSVIGATLASLYLYNALNAILPGWNTTTRDNETVCLQTPWIGASKDALTLLLNNSNTAVDAIIQLDNRYAIN